VSRRRRAEELELVARGLQERLDDQARQLRVLSDAMASLTVETAAGARESRGLELLIATQLDMLRGRLAAINQMCEVLGERADMDRLERRRLTEALVEITRGHIHGLPPAERAVDVTVFELADEVLVEAAGLEGQCDSAEDTDAVARRWRRS
jgi:hypothetical protein